MKRSVERIVMIVSIFVFIYLLSLNPIQIDITDEYLTLLPSLILLVFSIYSVQKTSGTAGVMAFGLLGLSLAYLTSTFYALGIIVNNIVTPTFTLQYLQAVIVLMSIVLGLILDKS